MQRDDDEVWRAIVANYGDRAEIAGDTETEHGPQDASTEEPAEDLGQAPAPDLGPEPAQEPAQEPVEDLHRADDQPFVPAAPPPLPRPPRDRLLAWAGVFGAPTLLLVFTLLAVSLPSWLTFLLVAGFVGGFLYLVIQMPRGPRDPFDDGARL